MKKILFLLLALSITSYMNIQGSLSSLERNQKILLKKRKKRRTHNTKKRSMDNEELLEEHEELLDKYMDKINKLEQIIEGMNLVIEYNRQAINHITSETNSSLKQISRYPLETPISQRKTNNYIGGNNTKTSGKSTLSETKVEELSQEVNKIKNKLSIIQLIFICMLAFAFYQYIKTNQKEPKTKPTRNKNKGLISLVS